MVNHGPIATNVRDPRTELSRTIWQWLSSRAILVIIGALIFLLFLCAAFIRQMPGQVAADQAAATRWLLTVSEEYGLLGNVLRTLGLFDVLHNPVLQLLLATLLIVLLVHLGNTVAALWRFWQIQQGWAKPVAMAGNPLPLPTTQPLYRVRQALAHSPQTVAAQLRQVIIPAFTEWRTITLPTTPYVAPLDASAPATAEPAAPAPSAAVEEVRLFASRHHLRWIWLRPLLIVGLLLALVAVWIILLAGWAITPAWLAPGDEYRATTQRVALAYTVDTAGSTPAPRLAAAIDDAAQEIPLGESRQLRWGQIRIEAKPGPPALLIRSTDAAVTLSRPGQTQRTANLGLVFPSLGSEDSVVVDNQIGIRVVRVPQSATPETGDTGFNAGVISPLTSGVPEHFLVEIYQNAAKPIQTLYVSQPMSTTILLSGTAREIWLIPVPSLAAAVRYQPGVWLLWLALALIVVGAIGFAYQPAFLLVQIAPWPTERAVVVVQSDVATLLNQIRLALV
ncbi:MAG: hypothetical protein KF832_16715 [Caldilineaceae bacterium]|nr:hypothetical protein [Caldilineaceae bacterium]